MAAVTLLDASGTVVVIAVVPGGASDRAGMRPGDVITRINGQTFTTALEADLVMRRGQTGRTTAYEILRGGRPVTLQVKLAAFGFTLGAAAAFLSGIAWMLFGTFLVMARPGVLAARLLGFAMLAHGFVLAVFFVRPFTQPTLSSTLRDMAMGGSLLAGFALAGITSLYFPRPHPTLHTRPWAVPVMAWTTLVAGVLAGLVALFATVNRAGIALLLAVAAVLVAVGAATRGLRRMRPAEEQRVLQPVLWASRGVGVATLALGIAMATGRLPQSPALIGIVLILNPAAYAWVIGRHRLFDLDLRVRRTVQYSVASLLWAVLSIAALVWLLLRLPSLELGLPNVRVRGASVEVLEGPAPPADQQWAERFVLMLGAIGLAFLFRKVGKDGQQWLATRFHRAEYDYKRASQDLSMLMATRPDLDGLADGFVDTLARLMPVDRVGVVFVHGARTHCARAPFGFEPDAWDGCCASASHGIVEAVGSAMRQVSVEYVAPHVREVLTRARVRFVYPIRHRDTLVGVLLVGDKKSETAFSTADFEFLDGIVRQMAPAVENAFLYEDLAEQQRLKHELEIARRIQLESLPQFTPNVPGLDIAAVSVPALEVGGDFYDYLEDGRGRLTIIVGDVSGKGTSAALHMSRLQGILRSLHAFELDLRSLFVRANALLCRDVDSRSFVTALGVVFDVAARHATLARAGHLPLYHYVHATGDLRRLLPRGLALGLSGRELFSSSLETIDLTFDPGDVFLLISDGIIESQSAQGEEFGDGRVIDWLADAAGRHESAAVLRDGLLDTARQFAGAVEQFDDQTVVVVRATTWVLPDTDRASPACP
jgi:serine phosphatase RsbU (regulator of sigma subunit)